MRVRPSGFSLIEILIVLFIISIIATLASVNIGSDNLKDRLETEVKHLTRVAEFALDEAQMSGRDYGLLLGVTKNKSEDVFFYRWSSLTRNGWAHPHLDTDAFADFFFDPRVQVELKLDDSPLEFVDIDASQSDSTPQIIFYSSGEASPGRLLWRLKETGEILCEIEWNIFGKFSFTHKVDDSESLKR